MWLLVYVHAGKTTGGLEKLMAMPLSESPNKLPWSRVGKAGERDSSSTTTVVSPQTATLIVASTRHVSGVRIG